MVEVERYWTKLKARLLLIRSTPGNHNWLFLPGGPGLGSESLTPLTALLQLPGTIWHLDLPGDGSNLVDGECFDKWPEALAEAAQALDNVILVAHSTGGMYALSTPKLQQALTGLVLMDSAPDAAWQRGFAKYVQDHPIPEMERLQKLYAASPSNELLRQLTIAGIPYLSDKLSLPFLEELPYNFRACDWSAQHFDQTYKAKWIPSMPTLIFAGANDRITPLELFKNAKEFLKPNILMTTIEDGGHFPWMENPDGVVAAFHDYCSRRW